MHKFPAPMSSEAGKIGQTVETIDKAVREIIREFCGLTY